MKFFKKNFLLHVIIFIYLFYFFSSYIHLPDPTYGDESILLNGAYRILQGDIIYKDFAEYIAPIPFYILAGLFKIFGVKLFVARILTIICITIISIFIYLVLKKITQNFLISIAGLISYIIPGYSFWYITSHHWILLAIELIVIYCLLLFLDKRNYIYIFISGLLVGLSPFIIQHKGGLFSISVTLWIFVIYLFYMRDKYNVVIYLISAFVIPLYLTIYFIKTENLIPMLDNVLFLSRRFFTSYFISLPFYFSTGIGAIKLFFNNIKSADLFGVIFNIMRIVYYIILGYTPFIVLPLSAVLFFKKSKTRDFGYYQTLLFLITGFLAFTGVFIGRTDQYQLITIFPFIIFPMACIWRELQEKKIFYNFMILFIIFLTLSSLIYGLHKIYEIKKIYIYSVVTPTGDRVYYKDKELADDIQNFYSYSGENIKGLIAFYWGDTYYFYLKKRNPLYYNLVSPLHLREDEINKIIIKIEETKPPHIIWDRYGTREWDYAAFPFFRPFAKTFVDNPLIDYIKEHYNVVAFFPVANIVVYKRKDGD